MRLLLLATVLLSVGCSETIELLALGGDGGSGACGPSAPQCNDCEDNDNDGRVDGFDPECTSAIDDDEGSFSTGIPGDNRDSIKQDCFYDGNSGSGDDGCDIHTCCILDLSGQSCPPEFQPNQFDPAECEPTESCIETCLPLTPPGCDCFGCCTVCDGADCVDILINPAVAPDCDSDVLDDPDLCPRCVKSTSCHAGCDPDNCILCPGQDPSDLPPGCDRTCPNGLTPCESSDSCAAGEFCASGCCVAIPE